MPQLRRLRAVAAALRGGRAPHDDGVNHAAAAAAGVGADPPRQRSGPLSGIRVVDMSAVISGPWAASMLADQGADVIKIEGPAGPDLTRGLGSAAEPGMASMYVTANRGKRSATIDLQQPRGVEVLKQMVRHSDVVIQVGGGRRPDSAFPACPA